MSQGVWASDQSFGGTWWRRAQGRFQTDCLSSSSCLNTDLLDFVDRRRVSSLKHRRLHKGARTAKRSAPLVPGRLDDEMNVPWLPSCMRPQADVKPGLPG